MRAYMRAKTIDGVIDEAHRRQGRPHRASRSRTCTRSWRSPTTRTGSSSRPRIARSARMPTICAAPAASRSAMAARTAAPRPACSARRSASQDSDGGRVMRKTLKVLSALLTYPTAELQAAVAEMRAALDAEERSAAAQRRRSTASCDELATGDLYDLQERYVAAVRPHALAVAAPVRARARREPRPRPGDGRPQGALRAARPVHELRPSCPIICRCSWSFCPRGRRSRGVRAARRDGARAGAHWQRLRKRKSAYDRCSRRAVRWRAAKPQGRCVAALLSEPDRTPTTSPPSMRPGRRRRSPSAPAPRADAARTARSPSVRGGPPAGSRHACRQRPSPSAVDR